MILPSSREAAQALAGALRRRAAAAGCALLVRRGELVEVTGSDPPEHARVRVATGPGGGRGLEACLAEAPPRLIERVPASLRTVETGPAYAFGGGEWGVVLWGVTGELDRRALAELEELAPLVAFTLRSAGVIDEVRQAERLARGLADLAGSLIRHQSLPALLERTGRLIAGTLERPVRVVSLEGRVQWREWPAPLVNDRDRDRTEVQRAVREGATPGRPVLAMVGGQPCQVVAVGGTTEPVAAILAWDGERPLNDSERGHLVSAAVLIGAAVARVGAGDLLMRSAAESRRKSEGFERLIEALSELLGATVDTPEALALIAVEKARRLLEHAGGALALLGSSAGGFRVIAASGYPGPLEGARRLGASEALLAADAEGPLLRVRGADPGGLLPGDVLGGQAVAALGYALRLRGGGSYSSWWSSAAGPAPARPAEAPREPAGALFVEAFAEPDGFDETDRGILELLARALSRALQSAFDHQEVEARAQTDGLTGLLNRREFDRRVQSEVARAVRYGHALGLVLLDLDHLKRINDTHGHQAGDDAIRHVAGSITGTVRSVDIACRFGGEEFAVILPEAAEAVAREVADRIRQAVAARPLPGVGRITVSVGVATLPRDAVQAADLVKRADEAAYAAKRAGRDRVMSWGET
jgi:diguanylate cyclase (GGDEF)-like protein